MAASGELVGFRYRGGAQSRPVALDRSLARLAAAQHGVVTRPQLVELGFSPRAITDRMARGGLVVLSHRSAAALWDLRPATRPTIDVTAPRTRVGRPGIDLHLSRCLEPHDRTEHKRIPTTTVARTLVDLAGVLETTGIERTWHRAEMLDLLDVQAVQDAVSHGRGRRGAGALRSLLAEHAPDHITRSELEERFIALCDDASLPRPEVNTRVPVNGTTYEVDFLWRDHHLVVETDGWGPHHTRASFEADRCRDADLLVAGPRVVRFTWRQITREPAAVAATLRALLAA